MKKMLKWPIFVVIPWLCFGIGRAQDVPVDPAKIAPNGARFLLVVETSSQNRRFESANRQAIFDLIVNGIGGHLRTGDTFGLWTYNNAVRAGEFPMTVWETNRSLELAGLAAAYLQKQKYAGTPDLTKVIANLRELSDRVDAFNVVIISSGRDPISGTPFDSRVNAAYEVYAKRPSRLAKLPMVTCFAVRLGRPIWAGVGIAGERIEFPERPPPKPPIAQSARTTNGTAVAAAGSPTPPTPTTNAPRRKVMQIVTKTNAPAPIANPGEEVASEVSSSNNSIFSLTNPITPDVANDSNAKGDTVTTAPGSNTNLAAPALVGSSDIRTNSTVAAVSTPASNPSPTPNESGASTEPGKAEPATRTSVSPVVPSVIPPAPALNSTPVSSGLARAPSELGATAQNLLSPAPLTVVARERSLGGAEPSRNAGGVASSGTPAIPVVATGGSAGLSAGVMLGIGAVLFGAAAFLFVLVLRRPHPDSARGSLITQSMGRGPQS